MRELELIIDEALVNGLSPYDNLPVNSQYLSDCKGFICAPGGLKIYDVLSAPSFSGITMYYTWPFPQFITGEGYNFMVVRDTVGGNDEVYVVTDSYSIPNLISINLATYGYGGLMEVADFGEYVYMTNGKACVYWNPTTSNWTIGTYSTYIPLMTTICNFKGQAVGGGVQSTWHDCDETYYAWSKIGQMDFTPDIKNTAGYRRCPYGGTIYHTRRLDDFVVGYSSKGITFLVPVSEPVATFGFKEMSNVGIINQGAMNGSLRRQIYIGDDYAIREVTSQGIKELGYRNHIENLALEPPVDIIVSYEKFEDKFYITNGTRGYVLTPQGLTEIYQQPSAVWRLGGTSYMLPTATSGTILTLTTEPFDMGYRGQKTVFSMESNLAYAESAVGQISVDYGTGFEDTDTKIFNDQGICPLIAAGNEFKFTTKIYNAASNTKLSYIKARYKMTDLRGLRGIYAPPLRGQSGG